MFHKLLSDFLLRMSLAMFAAPFDNNSNNVSNNSDNIIDKKRQQAHNKTQKIYPKENFDTNKVNNVLEKIYNNLDNDNDDDDDTFKVSKNETFSNNSQKTKNTVKTEESMINMTSQQDNMFKTLGRAPQPNYEGSDNLDLNNYNNYGDNKSAEEYYKRILPGYKNQVNSINKQYYNNNNIQSSEYPTQDILIQKLNYMISLLEDQQDEKTNNVTEEVILYSFLGIFIIFIADTFVRVGKYVR